MQSSFLEEVAPWDKRFLYCLLKALVRVADFSKDVEEAEKRDYITQHRQHPEEHQTVL